MSAHLSAHALLYHQSGDPYPDYSIDHGVHDATNHLTDHEMLPSELDHLLQISALQRQSLALHLVKVLRLSRRKSTFTGRIFSARQNGRTLTERPEWRFATMRESALLESPAHKMDPLSVSTSITALLQLRRFVSQQNEIRNKKVVAFWQFCNAMKFRFEEASVAISRPCIRPICFSVSFVLSSFAINFRLRRYTVMDIFRVTSTIVAKRCKLFSHF